MRPLHEGDPGQDQHAANQLHRPGTLPEQYESKDHREDHLSQRHERRQRATEPAHRDDAARIREHRANQDQQQGWEPPADGPVRQDCDPGLCSQRKDAGGRGSQQDHRTDARPGCRQQQRVDWRIGSLVLAEEEVRAETQGRTQTPGDADRIEGQPVRRSRTKARPTIDNPAPASTGHAGRRWLRAQCQAISMTGARYSSSKATPTERYCTALK